ncbi:MAG: hypothetical protein ACKVLI_03630 [Alphaproteobacteria bacterium]|jgi:hypothetical protein|tara:strand:- start:23382 stop:23591 length:210 start_codon:yes stop_codon:yes gene_type:complete
MSNNIKIGLAIVVLSGAGFYIYSSISDGTDSRSVDRLIRPNQSEEPAELGSKTIEFDTFDDMAHYGFGS